MTDVVFISKSGSDAYGWAKEGSDLDLRMVWIPKWTEAVGLKHKERGKQLQHLAVDITSFSIHHYFNLLIKGNGNGLENLFQPKIFEDPETVNSLKELCLNNLHVGYLKHWLGYSNTLLKDRLVKSRLVIRGVIKPLLDCYRVLQSGIILAMRKEVIWNLDEQSKHVDYNNALALRNMYLNDTVPNEADIENCLVELDEMRRTLSHMIASCNWLPLDSKPFDDWLHEYYKKIR